MNGVWLKCFAFLALREIVKNSRIKRGDNQHDGVRFAINHTAWIARQPAKACRIWYERIPKVNRELCDRLAITDSIADADAI